MLHRIYIFKWLRFHCHVGFRGCRSHWCNLLLLMAGQPVPPLTFSPSEIKLWEGLIKGNQWLISHKPLVRPYFWGGVTLGWVGWPAMSQPTCHESGLRPIDAGVPVETLPPATLGILRWFVGKLNDCSAVMFTLGFIRLVSSLMGYEWWWWWWWWWFRIWFC